MSSALSSSASLSSTTPTAAIAVNVSPAFAISARITFLRTSIRSKNAPASERNGRALLKKLVDLAQSSAAQFIYGTASGQKSTTKGLDAGSIACKPKTSYADLCEKAWVGGNPAVTFPGFLLALFFLLGIAGFGAACVSLNSMFELLALDD